MYTHIHALQCVLCCWWCFCILPSHAHGKWRWYTMCCVGYSTFYVCYEQCVLWCCDHAHIRSCRCCCYFWVRYYCSLLKILVVFCLKYTSNHIFECSAKGIQQICSSFFPSLVVLLPGSIVRCMHSLCVLRFSDHSFGSTTNSVRKNVFFVVIWMWMYTTAGVNFNQKIKKNIINITYT